MTVICGVDNVIKRKIENNVMCKKLGHGKMKRFLQFHWLSETCQMATTPYIKIKYWTLHMTVSKKNQIKNIEVYV